MRRKTADDYMDSSPIPNGACYVYPGVPCKNHAHGACVGNPANYDSESYEWNGSAVQGAPVGYGGKGREEGLDLRKQARKAGVCRECFVHFRLANEYQETKNEGTLTSSVAGVSPTETTTDSGREGSATLGVGAERAGSVHQDLVPQTESSSVVRVPVAGPVEKARQIAIGSAEQSASFHARIEQDRIRQQNARASVGRGESTLSTIGTIAAQQESDAATDEPTLQTSLKRKHEADSSDMPHAKKSVGIVTEAPRQDLRGILKSPGAKTSPDLKMVTFVETEAVEIFRATIRNSLSSVDESIRKLEAIINDIQQEEEQGLARKNHTQPRLLSANVCLKTVLHWRKTIRDKNDHLAGNMLSHPEGHRGLLEAPGPGELRDETGGKASLPSHGLGDVGQIEKGDDNVPGSSIKVHPPEVRQDAALIYGCLRSITVNADKDSIPSLAQAITLTITTFRPIKDFIASGQLNGTEGPLLLGAADRSLQKLMLAVEETTKELSEIRNIPSIINDMFASFETVAGVDWAIKRYTDSIAQLEGRLKSGRRTMGAAFGASLERKVLMAELKVSYDCRLVLLQRMLDLVKA